MSYGASAINAVKAVATSVGLHELKAAASSGMAIALDFRVPLVSGYTASEANQLRRVRQKWLTHIAAGTGTAKDGVSAAASDDASSASYCDQFRMNANFSQPLFAVDESDFEPSVWLAQLKTVSLLRPAVEAAIKAICTYQLLRRARSRGEGRGHKNDPTMLVLEEWKRWIVSSLYTAAVDEPATALMITQRIRYAESLMADGVFPPGNQTSTMLGVLIAIRKQLKSAHELVQSRLAANSAREHLSALERFSHSILHFGVQYVFAILRDDATPSTNAAAGATAAASGSANGETVDIRYLRAAAESIAALTSTAGSKPANSSELAASFAPALISGSGYALRQLVTCDAFNRLFAPPPPSSQPDSKSNQKMLALPAPAASVGAVSTVAGAWSRPHANAKPQPMKTDVKSAPKAAPNAGDEWVVLDDDDDADRVTASNGTTELTPELRLLNAEIEHRRAYAAERRALFAAPQTSGICSFFQSGASAAAVIDTFMLTHTLLHSIAELTVLATTARQLAGRGGSVLVYGVHANQLCAVLRSYGRVLTEFRSRLTSIDEAADGAYESYVTGPSGGMRSVSEAARLKLWAANYSSVLSVRWSLYDLVSRTLSLLNEMVNDITSKSFAERVNEARKESDQFSLMAGRVCTEIDALLLPASDQHLTGASPAASALHQSIVVSVADRKSHPTETAAKAHPRQTPAPAASPVPAKGAVKLSYAAMVGSKPHAHAHAHAHAAQ